MERYSNSTREVAQDGRRGALMMTVSIKHPDSEAFIDAKMTPRKVTAQMCLCASTTTSCVPSKPNALHTEVPRQLRRAAGDKRNRCRSPLEENSNERMEIGRARRPFWDTIRRESVPDCYADLGFETISTNPCGEIPSAPMTAAACWP